MLETKNSSLKSSATNSFSRNLTNLSLECIKNVSELSDHISHIMIWS